MTPTVPLPPAREVWTSCAQALQAWTEGRIRSDSLIDGAVVLADGTRCPVGQPDLARTGVGVWTAIGAGCLLIIVGILVLIVREQRERGMDGRHHWLGNDDLEPNDSAEERDVELLAAVTGLGEQREPDEQARTAAAEMPDDWPDLRGERDIDPQAPHPWREGAP